jgi:hypothetical protein
MALEEEIEEESDMVISLTEKAANGELDDEDLEMLNYFTWGD